MAQLASWQGDYEHSLRLYDELAAAYPEDPVFPWEAARVAGWAGERDEAQGRYAALLASVQAGDIGVQRSSGADSPSTPFRSKGPSRRRLQHNLEHRLYLNHNAYVMIYIATLDM